MTGPVITAALIHADGNYHSELTQEQRVELFDWMRRTAGHHLPAAVSVEYLIVDLPMIEISSWAIDAEGVTPLDPSGQLILVRRDYLVREPLPSWWRPNSCRAESAALG